MVFFGLHGGQDQTSGFHLKKHLSFERGAQKLFIIEGLEEIVESVDPEAPRRTG